MSPRSIPLEELEAIAHTDDRPRLEELLSAGLDGNLTDEDQRPPLAVAAEAGALGAFGCWSSTGYISTPAIRLRSTPRYMENPVGLLTDRSCKLRLIAGKKQGHFKIPVEETLRLIEERSSDPRNRDDYHGLADSLKNSAATDSLLTIHFRSVFTIEGA